MKLWDCRDRTRFPARHVYEIHGPKRPVWVVYGDDESAVSVWDNPKEAALSEDVVLSGGSIEQRWVSSTEKAQRD